MAKLSVVVELWRFLGVRKKWWLAPVAGFLIMLGTVLVLAQGSAMAPFIYALF